MENGQKTFQVICGAPNVKKGMKGIFAADGMYIPGTDITLKKVKFVVKCPKVCILKN